MFAKNLVQRIKEYPGGSHHFYTYGDGCNLISLQDLVKQTPYEVMTIYTSNVGIGTTLPQVSLDINSKTAIQLPSGSNDQRPEGIQGYLRYNIELNQFEGFGAGDNNWRALAGLKNVAADTYILADYSPGSDDKGLHFYTNGKERMIINSNGWIGLGMDYFQQIPGSNIPYPRQPLDITCNMIVQGNVGIGTLIPLNPLHLNNDAIFMNGNVGIGTMIPTGTVEVVGTVYASSFIVNDIYTSNLTLSGEYIVLNAGQEQINQLQIEPIYTTFQITDTNRTDYTLVCNGLFRISPEKTDVYINGYKMAYKAINSKDYDVRYEFDVFNLKSLFTVVLNAPVEYGDVVHIVFWPNYLQDAGTLRAGYLLQEIDLRQWKPFTGSNIHYVLGNVGIGVTDANYTLEVQGNGSITTLSNETLSIKERLTTSLVGIGTLNPIVSLSVQTTDGIHLPMGTTQQRPRVGEGVIRYNTSLNLYEGSFSNQQWLPIEGLYSSNLQTFITASNDQTLRFYTNNTLQMVISSNGNVGIGTNNPQATLEVNGNGLIQDTLYVEGNLQSASIQANLDVQTQYDLLNESLIRTSNLSILRLISFDPNTQTLKKNIQLHPIRQSFYINSSSQSNLTLMVHGMYDYTSNIYIYTNQTLLSYYSSNIRDYDISVSYDDINLKTYYHITIIEPLSIGELVDVILYPQFKSGYEPYDGYMYQQLQTDNIFIITNSNDIAYTFGNVGIGTNVTEFGTLTVAGHIVPSSNLVYNLGTSNLRFKDLYLSGTTIDLEGSKIQRNPITGGIEFVYASNINSNAFVNTMRQVQAEQMGIGTSFARAGLDVIGNVYFQGNVGIGTSLSCNEEVRLEGNLLSYTMTLSNLTSINRPTLSVFQENTNVPFFQAYGKEGLECQIDGEGNMDLYGDHLQLGEDRSPAFPLHAPIGMENLYTWSGNVPIVQGQEPLVRYFTPGYSNFDRIKVFGSSAYINTSYYTSPWNNNQYMIGFYNTDFDSTAGVTITTPVNYGLISMPVKPGVSHSFFIKVISYDRWTTPLIFITNKTRTSFYRLQSQANSYVITQPSTIWMSPYLETSSSHTYHDWIMYSIPKYVIDQYAFDEYCDDKSRYRKNIHICIMRGYGNTSAGYYDGNNVFTAIGNDANIWCTGFAMRTNPYGLTFHNATSLYWGHNGGSTISWYSGNWNYIALAYFALNSTYNNIRIPICPSNDPTVSRLNDFYLVFISWAINSPSWPMTYVYLQNPSNASDLQFIGRPNKSIKGRYGNFLKEVNRHGLGVIIPSPDPKFLVYVGGRPYLNLQVRTNISGWTTDHSYTVGCFTEEIDPTGRNYNLSLYNSMPIVWN